MRGFVLIAGILASWPVLVQADAGAELSPAERGRRALETRAFSPGIWKQSAYENVWRHWGKEAKKAPENYLQAFMDRYGLHPPPYPNGRYPMGLREGRNFLGKGLTADCLLCHAGSIAGKSYIGLGNSALDFQALFEDLGKADGGSGKMPFVFSNVRGTTEAGSFVVFLLGYREPDLKLRLRPVDLGLRGHLCMDVPAWWLLKKKKTMYHTGSTDARSVRSLMQFMLASLNSREAFDKEEPTFADIQAYLFSLEAPKYPFAIDRPLAEKGSTLFKETCARCHGTYGPNWTYPSKVVPIDVIGTDRSRYVGLTQRFGDYYNKSWFAEEKGRHQGGYRLKDLAGYQAPPLDGIWATAPYFHNGSVPTVYDVLNSKTRPKIYTRSFGTGTDDYDPVKVGWKVQVLDRGPDPSLPAYERRKVYDTTQPGRGNAGHTFGDNLRDADRRAVIEYLKTL